MTRTRGFTLIQLLVVLGIIVLLMSILLPAISKARRQANKIRLRGDLMAIASALEQYKSDFGDYPRPPAGSFGYQNGLMSTVLAMAMMGPGNADPLVPANFVKSPAGVSPAWTALPDGADGAGFRVNVPADEAGTLHYQGKVWGPYLAPERFKLAGVTVNATDPPALLDFQGHPILYCVGSKMYFSTYSGAGVQPTITGFTNGTPNKGQYVGELTGGTFPMYDITQNENKLPGTDQATWLVLRPGETDVMAEERMASMLGDYNHNFIIDNGESPKTTGPYILWCAGEDGLFGTTSPTPTRQEVEKCDDVFNFD